MDRVEYNHCMSPYIRGSKPKEQRKLDFCIGAKICSGKASSPEEAKTLCLNAPPKEPKARKSKKRPDGCPPCPPCDGAAVAPVAQNLSCPQRKDRVFSTIEHIIEQAKEGKADSVLAESELVKKDVAACFPDECQTIANGAHDFLKQMSKGYYFKRETNELKDQLGALKVMIGG